MNRYVHTDVISCVFSSTSKKEITRFDRFVKERQMLTDFYPMKSLLNLPLNNFLALFFFFCFSLGFLVGNLKKEKNQC